MLLDALDELQIAGSQVRSTFEDGNNSTIAKAFVCAIFIEVEPAFLLVIDEVNIEIGELLLDLSLVFTSNKRGRAIDAEAIGIDP